MKEALFYKKLSAENKVSCLLCPHHCRLAPGEAGLCRGRSNHDGVLIANNYGQSANIPSLDPIEKKPLYHFRPGSAILSLGPNSCNLSCRFCQNWRISQQKVPTVEVTPKELAKLSASCGAVAFTYTEPLMWYEFLLDSGRVLKDAGIKLCLVSNATISAEPLKKLLPFVDAANYDLKSFDPKFYKNHCNGRLETVLETIRETSQSAHVELTFLMIPELNDDPALFDSMCAWIAENSGQGTPLHISRYFPNYKLQNPSTSLKGLEEFSKIAQKHLDFVYLGNAPGKADTHCRNCGKLLVARSGYFVEVVGLDGTLCRYCQSENNFLL